MTLNSGNTRGRTTQDDKWRNISSVKLTIEIDVTETRTMNMKMHSKSVFERGQGAEKGQSSSNIQLGNRQLCNLPFQHTYILGNRF
jgi:hypothetical protein